MRKIMACLDVGTDSIKLVVGEMVKNKLNVLAVADAPSKGVSNGYLEDPNLLMEPLKSVIHRCEETLGLSIRQMIVCVPSMDAKYTVVTGNVNVRSEDKVIEGIDIIKAVNSSLKRSNEDSYEIINMLPTGFILDDGSVVKNPRGMTSNTLGVRGVLIYAPKKNFYPILACLASLNIEVLDINLDIIGSYYEFRNKELDNEVGAIIDMGAASVGIGIFNKSIITNSTVLNVGGNTIDKDLSYIFKTDVSVSKDIKDTLTILDKELISNTDTMSVVDSLNRNIVVNQEEASNIVISRLEEILNLCNKEINNLTKKEISYIIFTGGLAELKEFRTLAIDIFGENVKIGNIFEMGVRNNKYSSCLGLIKYYAHDARLKERDYSIFTIEEQQQLSGPDLDEQGDNKIGKLFGYIFNG